MARLRILRPHHRLWGGGSAALYIDNDEVGKIDSGEVREFDVLPGDYILRGKLNWFGSQDVPISISDNGIKVYMVNLGNKKYNRIIQPIAFFSLAISILNSWLYKSLYLSFILSIPILMFIIPLLYQISFNRKKFIKFTPVELPQ